MIRLFYISVASPTVTRKDHEQILEASRRNNRHLGITGLLIAKGNHFAQALEGPADLVTEQFQRIEKDPRHNGVVVISRTEITERIFPSWDMGYRDLDILSVSPELRHVDLSDPRFVSSPDQLSMVFRSFVERVDPCKLPS